MKRSKLYYTTRSIVRTAFWGTLGLATLLLVVEATDDDRTPCDVTLHKNFTWSAPQHPVPLDECRHPSLTILNRDGTWQWVNEDDK